MKKRRDAMNMFFRDTTRLRKNINDVCILLIFITAVVQLLTDSLLLRALMCGCVALVCFARILWEIKQKDFEMRWMVIFEISFIAWTIYALVNIWRLGNLFFIVIVSHN